MNQNTLKKPTLRSKIKVIVEKLREKDIVIQASLWEISKSDTLSQFNKLKSAILNSSEDSECVVNSKKLIGCLNTLINRTGYVTNDLAKQKIAEIVQELADLVNQET